MRKLFIITSAVLSLLAWICIVYVGTLNGWFHISVAEIEDTSGFVKEIKKNIKSKHNGNIVLLLIEDGKIYDTYSYSTGQPVNENSVYQIASVSKWVTAVGVMKLVEEGLLDLDKPVMSYLTRWSFPASEFSDLVTPRYLLSHTGGLDDGLGYLGFLNKKDMQTIEDSLTKANDSNKSRKGIVRIKEKPGNKFMYSGGGYTLLQLLIEEVTNTPFNDYMKNEILNPLGMKSSTYIVDDYNLNQLAESFDKKGNLVPYRYYTALAAASLHSTVSDLAKFALFHSQGINGEKTGRGILDPSSLLQMRKPHAKKLGINIWGLGVILYTKNSNGEYIIGHDGDNYPGIGTTIRYIPSSRDGIIVLNSGNKSIARDIGSKWIVWKTNHPSFLELLSTRTIITLILGLIIITLLNIIIFIKFLSLYQ